MDAGIAHHALESPSGVVNLFDVGVLLDQRPHFRRLAIPLVLGIHDARQRNVLRHDRRRQCLGDTVGDLIAGLAEVDAGGILDRGLRLDRAEGDDLGDLVRAPFI